MPSASPDPWYADGLAFACRACGRCCRGPDGYVWLTRDEARGLAGALGLDEAAFHRQYLRRTLRGLALRDDPRGDCILLDGAGRCRAYGARPLQCRTYPWWPETLSCPTAWEAQARTCPGIGSGPVVPREEIDREMRKADT
jgi:hypothetical protein